LNPKHFFEIGLAIGVSIIAYLLDIAREFLGARYAIGFQTTPMVLHMVAANLLFAGLVIFVFARLYGRASRLGLRLFLIILGVMMIVLPAFFFPSTAINDIILPYRMMRVTYANITGSMWIVLGILSLFGNQDNRGRKT
jgi:hypothetical protein